MRMGLLKTGRVVVFKKLFLISLGLGFVQTFGAIDAKAAPLVDENICILENMGSTRSPQARRFISDACNFLSLQEASLILNREQREFHECVLKYVPGTEVDLNATDMTRACRQLVWDGKKIP